MPLLFPGCYSDSGEKAYEKESCYYIEFQIISSLASIEYITNENIDCSAFNNKFQYYHYYCDHLMYSLGQISNRFIINDRNDKGINLERKQMNIKNFFFDKDTFPILSNKQAKNTIEHIDEFNNEIISRNNGVGGFNVIDKETSEEFVNAIDNDMHIYTLNLVKREILVIRKQEKIVINLDELKNELLTLKEKVSDLLSIISTP